MPHDKWKGCAAKKMGMGHFGGKLWQARIRGHTLPKSRLFGLRFFGRTLYGYNFSHCDVNCPKDTEFGELTQNNGHHAVQGHSRSAFSVPIERPRTTLCVWIIVTYVQSCTVAKILRIIGPIFAVDKRVFNKLVRGNLWIQDCEIWPQETRNIISYDTKYISTS